MTSTLTNVHPADDTAAGGYRPGYDASNDLQLALDELHATCPEYIKAEQYYADERPEVFTSARMRAALSRGDVNFRLNFACKPVDTLAERLEISSITAISDDPDLKALADAWIGRFYEDNDFDTGHKDVMHCACEYGDSYVLVWPTDIADPGAGVDIYLNRPHGCRVFYDPEKTHRKAFGVKQWVLPATRQIRVDLYYLDHLERYITQPGVDQSRSATDFTAFFEDGDYDPDDLEPGELPAWPVNPYGEIPIFHFRNGTPYGVPEHKRFWGTQDILRKLVMGHVSGVDYQSAPQRAALMKDGYSADHAMDDEDDYGFPATGGGEPVTNNASQRTNLEGGDDTVWWLQGVDQLLTLDPADPRVFTEPMLVYLRFGAQVVDMPLYRIDPTGSVPSGESRRVAEGPFVLKVIDRQQRYISVWRSVFRFALKIVGVEVDVMVHWKSPAIVDDQTGWATLLIKLQAGIPRRQAFAEQGYSADQIEAWFGTAEEEQDEEDLPLAAETLLKIGQALQALGAAVGFGVITLDQVQQLIVSVINDPEQAAGDAIAAAVDPSNPDTPPAPAVAEPVVSGAQRQ
jgi:hypothetical protein